MKMHTPPENAGQIVETSYGWVGSCLYRRVYDRAERSSRWYRASDDTEVSDYIESGAEPWNGAPRVSQWVACAEPADDA